MKFRRYSPEFLSLPSACNKPSMRLLPRNSDNRLSIGSTTDTKSVNVSGVVTADLSVAIGDGNADAGWDGVTIVVSVGVAVTSGVSDGVTLFSKLCGSEVDFSDNFMTTGVPDSICEPWSADTTDRPNDITDRPADVADDRPAREVRNFATFAAGGCKAGGQMAVERRAMYGNMDTTDSLTNFSLSFLQPKSYVVITTREHLLFATYLTIQCTKLTKSRKTFTMVKV